jgi:hypothetical protein
MGACLHRNFIANFVKHNNFDMLSSRYLEVTLVQSKCTARSWWDSQVQRPLSEEPWKILMKTKANPVKFYRNHFFFTKPSTFEHFLTLSTFKTNNFLSIFLKADAFLVILVQLIDAIWLSITTFHKYLKWTQSPTFVRIVNCLGF